MVWLSLAAVQFAIVLPVVLPVMGPYRLAYLLNHSHLRPRPDEIAGIGAPLTQMFSDEMAKRGHPPKVTAEGEISMLEFAGHRDRG